MTAISFFLTEGNICLEMSCDEMLGTESVGSTLQKQSVQADIWANKIQVFGSISLLIIQLTTIFDKITQKNFSINFSIS